MRKRRLIRTAPTGFKLESSYLIRTYINFYTKKSQCLTEHLKTGTLFWRNLDLLRLCAGRQNVASAATISCLSGPGGKNGRNKRATTIRPAGEETKILVQAQNGSTDGATGHGQS